MSTDILEWLYVERFQMEDTLCHMVEVKVKNSLKIMMSKFQEKP